MINTGPFLWNGSSKIQIFTDIWYPLCRRLLRPAYVNFLKTGWWNSNFQTSGMYRYLQAKSNLHISICQSHFKRNISMWNTLYVLVSQSLEFPFFQVKQNSNVDNFCRSLTLSIHSLFKSFGLYTEPSFWKSSSIRIPMDGHKWFNPISVQ